MESKQYAKQSKDLLRQVGPTGWPAGPPPRAHLAGRQWPLARRSPLAARRPAPPPPARPSAPAACDPPACPTCPPLFPSLPPCSQALIRKYLPLAAVLVVVLLVLWLRSKFF
jgi:hypothetical protein